jgi:transposase InsO family protein
LTPARAPKANAIAERVIGTIRRDCLDHLIVLTERHLRRVLREYVAYYNDTRPHQSLFDQPPSGPRTPALRDGAQRLASRPILGGLHHEYFWEAA